MRLLIILFITLSSCTTIKVVNNFDENNLKELLGKKITIQGKAINARLGAMLMVENNKIIWIDNKDNWPTGYYSEGFNGKTLKVTGILIEKYDLPVFIQKKGEPARSGMPVPEGTDLKEASHRYLLENITWKVISD